MTKKTKTNTRSRQGPKRTKPSRRGQKPHQRSNGLLVFVIALCVMGTIGYAIAMRGPVDVGGVKIDLIALKDKLLSAQDETPREGETQEAEPAEKKVVRSRAFPELKPEQRWYNQELNPQTAPSEFAGRYFSFFGSKQFELYINDGIYQIVFYRDGSNKRLYTNGVYGFKGDLLALSPDPSLGAPPDPNNAHVYEKMTEDTYTVEVEKIGDFFSWDPGVQIVNGVERLVKHPVFHLVDANRIVWREYPAGQNNSQE